MKNLFYYLLLILLILLPSTQEAKQDQNNDESDVNTNEKFRYPPKVKAVIHVVDQLAETFFEYGSQFFPKIETSHGVNNDDEINPAAIFNVIKDTWKSVADKVLERESTDTHQEL
uniref:Uncharacterized protein n=1 Tax=Strigamia maritima TaxID=126957 RepID=T1J0A8_STRMM